MEAPDWSFTWSRSRFASAVSGRPPPCPSGWHWSSWNHHSSSHLWPQWPQSWIYQEQGPQNEHSVHPVSKHVIKITDISKNEITENNYLSVYLVSFHALYHSLYLCSFSLSIFLSLFWRLSLLASLSLSFSISLTYTLYQSSPECSPLSTAWLTGSWPGTGTWAACEVWTCPTAPAASALWQGHLLSREITLSSSALQN